jgi:hypothetical protein
MLNTNNYHSLPLISEQAFVCQYLAMNAQEHQQMLLDSVASIQSYYSLQPVGDSHKWSVKVSSLNHDLLAVVAKD